MRGRAAIYNHSKRIEAAFKRATAVSHDPELLSDYAKYLCILVSGYIEKSLAEIALEHARRTSAPSVQRFVEKNTARFSNANSEKVLQLLGSFDPDWRSTIEDILVDQYKDAFDSVVSLRNQIAHGTSVGVTYVRIKEYFEAIREMVERIQNLCIPSH